MGKDRIFGLDLMRATAILMVLFGHLWWLLPNRDGMLGQLASLSGFLGVEVFFVLSGFLIGLILLRLFLAPGFGFADVFRFLQRRWLRTLPNYFLILAINIAIASWLMSSVPSWRYVFFLQNFNTPMPDFFTESWSLSVEEWAYLLLPIALVFVALITKIQKLWMFTAIVLLLLLFGFMNRWVFHSYLGVVRMEFWNVALKSVVIYRLDAIWMGVLMAVLYSAFPILWMRSAKMLLVPGFLLLAFIVAGMGKLGISMERFPLFWNVFYLPVVSICCCCFLPLCSEWKTFKFAFPIQYVSRISYALYLVHYGIAMQLTHHFLGHEPKVAAIVYLILSFSLASLVYRLIELPFLRLRARKFPQNPSENVFRA